MLACPRQVEGVHKHESPDQTQLPYPVMTSALNAVTPNPWVFMDFTMDNEPLGRVVFELRNDIAPVACENFRSLCTGWKGLGRFDKPLHYKNNRVHRCIPDRLLMAGDIICQDGTSGESIYGDTFEDENFVLRHAGPGTLSTCNRGPDTNDSRFFISLGMADFLDDKSVVFGYVMTGMDTIRDIERVGTPNTGEMRKEVLIVDCGECTPQWGSALAQKVYGGGDGH